MASSVIVEADLYYLELFRMPVKVLSDIRYSCSLYFYRRFSCAVEVVDINFENVISFSS